MNCLVCFPWHRHLQSSTYRRGTLQESLLALALDLRNGLVPSVSPRFPRILTSPGKAVHGEGIKAFSRLISRAVDTDFFVRAAWLQRRAWSYTAWDRPCGAVGYGDRWTSAYVTEEPPKERCSALAKSEVREPALISFGVSRQPR